MESSKKIKLRYGELKRISIEGLKVAQEKNGYETKIDNS